MYGPSFFVNKKIVLVFSSKNSAKIADFIKIQYEPIFCEVFDEKYDILSINNKN